MRHVPNALTIARLAAIPVFIVVLWDASGGHSVLAALIFGVASLTDYLDGYLARRLNVQSRFGRLADPLADRLLIASAVLLLYYHDRVPLLVPLLVLGRDLVLLSGLGFAADKGYELSVIWPDVLLYIGIGLSLAAGAVYVATVSRRLGKPSSSA